MNLCKPDRGNSVLEKALIYFMERRLTPPGIYECYCETGGNYVRY